MQNSQEELPGAAALASFYREDETKREFTEDLRGIFEVIAGTGKYWHDWAMLKSLFSFRLKQVLTEYYESHMAGDIGSRQNLISGETYPDLVKRLDQALDSFVEGPPFTVQRLCEILLKPQSIYPNIAKASLALEKILLVTSTLQVCVDPYPSLPLSTSSAHEEVAGSQEQNLGSPKQNGIQEPAAIVDVEMVDAVTEEEEKAETTETTEQRGQLDSMTEEPTEISSDGDTILAPVNGVNAAVDS